MTGKTVTIKEIANILGLSKTTVSYVLSGKYQSVNIAPETAERVLNTARNMGYRSNFWAKSLVNKRSKLIGVLYPDISSSSAHQITQGIQDVLGQNDYEAILAVSFWNPEKEHKEVELMLEKQVAGIISLPQAGSEKTYQMPLRSECPVVFVADYLPEIPASSVTLDPEDAIHKLLNHMHQSGKRKIHLLSVNYPSTTLLERENAFKTGLAKLGLEFQPEDISYTELAMEISIYEKVRQIIQRPDRPDALICISDSVALQAVAELARMNISIPNDLAVAGIGNLDFTDHPFFAMTTVDEYRKE